MRTYEAPGSTIGSSGALLRGARPTGLDEMQTRGDPRLFASPSPGRRSIPELRFRRHPRLATRRSLQRARRAEPEVEADRKVEAVRVAVRHEFPTGDWLEIPPVTPEVVHTVLVFQTPNCTPTRNQTRVGARGGWKGRGHSVWAGPQPPVHRYMRTEGTPNSGSKWTPRRRSSRMSRGMNPGGRVTSCTGEASWNGTKM